MDKKPEDVTVYIENNHLVIELNSIFRHFNINYFDGNKIIMKLEDGATDSVVKRNGGFHGRFVH